MRFVHISDVHYSDQSSTDQKVLTKAFLRDIAGFHAQIPVDFVVFSGDLTFGARPDEFKLAMDDLLSPLETALSISRDRIIIAHGNHDNDRSRIIRHSEAGLRTVLNSREAVNSLLDDDEALNDALTRTQNWRDFCGNYYGAPYSLWKGLTSQHLLNISEHRVAVICVDSAWRSVGKGDSEDRAALLIGDRQMRQAETMVRDADVRILVSHHPFDWLTDFDKESTQAAVDRSFDYVLTGHTHHTSPRANVSSQGSYVHSAAGSLYQGREYTNGYNIIDVDLSSKSCSITCRTFSETRDAFVPDTHVTDTGVVEYSTTTRNRAVTPARSDYAQAAENRRLSGIAVLESLRAKSLVPSSREEPSSFASVLDMTATFIVPPVLLPIPYTQWMVSAKTGSENRISRDDPGGYFKGRNCLLVIGESGTGLTTTLNWLTLETVRKRFGLLPVTIDASTLRSPRDPVTPVIKRALGAALVRLPEEGCPPVCVAFENFGDLRDVDIERLAEYVSGHPEHLYILGCQPDQTDRLKRALALSRVDHDVCHIGRFGRTEIRSLISKSSVTSADKVLERVSTMLAREGVARTPLMVAALVNVVGTNPEYALGENETAVLGSYIDLLLGRNTGESSRFSLDYRSREYLLAALAEDMIRRQSGVMTRVDIEAFFSDCFVSRGWNEKAGAFVDALINRHILYERAKQVSFRHNALLALFAAKRVYENVSFKELIVDNIGGYSNIVRHAAGTSRDDVELLEKARALLPSSTAVQAGDLFGEIADQHGWTEGSSQELLATQLGVPTQVLVPDENEEVTVDDEDDEDEDEEIADRIWEQAANRPARDIARPLNVDALEPVTRLRHLTGLASQVLRSSEFLTDVSLKTRTLSEVLAHWSDVAALIASDETARQTTREALEEILKKPGEELTPAMSRVVEQSLLILPVVIAYASMDDALTSSRLALPLRQLLNDNTFMGRAGPALMACLLNGSIRDGDWVGDYRAVLHKYSGIRTVVEVIHWIANISLFGENLPENDASALEDVLVDARLLLRNVSRSDEGRQRGLIKQDISRARARRVRRASQHAKSALDPE